MYERFSCARGHPVRRVRAMSAARIAIDARKLRDFGIGSHLANLLSGLARVDGEERFTVVVPPGAKLPSPAGEDPRFEAVPCAARGYGLREHLALPHIARRAGAALYHAPHYVLPKGWRGPSVVTIHDLIHLRFPEYLPNRAARLYARHVIGDAYRRADLVLTVSEATRRDLLDEFGGEPDRIRVVANTVSDAFALERDEGELEEARSRLALPRRFVIAMGNPKPHKDLATLLRGMCLVRASPGLGDVELALVGAGRGAVEALCESAGARGVPVHALGRLQLDDVARVLRCAEVLAHPALYEGFGMPVAEALAAGTPVVASRAASLPEVGGEAAEYFEPGDVEGLARALAAVLGDPRTRSRMAREGRERAGRFLGGRLAEETLEVYRSALARHRPPR